jgi:hypothetical protein
MDSPRHRTSCSFCTTSFRKENPHALKKHMKSAHPHCAPCNRTFISDAALQAHLENSSRHVDEFHCCSCDRDFRSMRALEDHLRDVSHEVIVVRENYCESCERQFGTEMAYEMHMASVVHKPMCEVLNCQFCGKSFAAVSALAHHLESGGCNGGATREMVAMTVMAADTQGVVVGDGTTAGGYVEETDSEESDDEDGGVVFTPGSSGALSRILTPPTPQSFSTALIPANPLACPLCPLERGPFVNPRALQQHLESPVHESKIYHCPTLLGGGQPKKEFSTISALLQHLEAGACKGGIKTFEAAVGFMTIKLREIGFGGVKLLQR